MEELSDIAGLLREPWVITGDFDAIRYVSSEKGSTKFTRSMKDFGCFINDGELLDFEMKGSQYI